MRRMSEPIISVRWEERSAFKALTFCHRGLKLIVRYYGRVRNQRERQILVPMRDYNVH